MTVPTGVASITVVADGGGGGKNANLGNGGSGARVSGSITVTPGQLLEVYVGSGGGAGTGGSGNVGGTGYGVGGNGGPFYGPGFGGGYGGGGGGSSAVVIAGTVAIVAGGGGGGGNYYGGSASAAAGGSGGNGGGSCAVGGGGGNANGTGGAGATSGTGNPTASTASYAGRGGGGIYGAGGASSGGGGGGAGYGGGGAGNWNGPQNSCTLAGGGGAGGSYGPPGAVFGSASNAGLAGAGGDGEVSITFVAAPATVPGVPTDLIFSDVDDTTMTAFWTPPASDGGSPVTGYVVSIDDSGTYLRDDTVTGPVHELTGLTPGHLYSLSIRALNVVGPSTSALTGSQMTTNPGTPAGPATNLVFSGTGASGFTVAWTAPAPVSGWPTLGYQVRVGAGGLTWVPSPTTSLTVGGLTPNTSYSVEVYVVNGAGTSTALTGTQSTYATVPDAPTNLVFSAVDDSAITASWTAPYDGGSAITNYWVSVDGGAAVSVPSTTYTATGLAPSTWHSFAIAAFNTQGSSLPLTGSRSTTAVPNSPMMTATSTTVGTATTVTLIDFPASTTQTVVITAPDATLSTMSVTVDGTGDGTGTFTPVMAGAYGLQTSPNATSTTFTASAAPGPGPGPGPLPPPAASIAPVTQTLDGVVGMPLTPTVSFSAKDFLQAPTYAVSPALPPGLDIDPLSGVVSGVPTSPAVLSKYVITAVAGAQSATASLWLTVSAAPGPAPTILITGRHGAGADKGRIVVTGITTGLAGEAVLAHVRLAGQRAYRATGTRPVAADGTFSWQRRTSRRAFVYFTAPGGERSNRVVILPAGHATEGD